jgi:hypothetical protein
MTNMMKSAMERLNLQRNTYMTESVIYKRDGSVMVADLQATPGKTVVRLDQGYGATVRKDIRDFLIDVADLVLNDTAVEPEKRDEIIYDGRIYEVSSPGNDEPEWRHTDAYRKTYRIHTKDMGADT